MMFLHPETFIPSCLPVRQVGGGWSEFYIIIDPIPGVFAFGPTPLSPPLEGTSHQQWYLYKLQVDLINKNLANTY